MKKFLLSVVFLSCMTSASLADIKVCRWVDSPLKQVEDQLLRELGERTGEPIVLKELPWVSIADFFEKKEDSMVAKHGNFQLYLGCLSDTRDIPHSVPYAVTYNKILSKKDSPIDRFIDLDGKKIAVYQGSFAEQFLPVKVPGSKVVPVQTNTMAELVELLRMRCVDALVADDISFEPFRDEFHMSIEKVAPSNIVVYFAESGVQYSDLMDDIIDSYLLRVD